MTTASHCRVLLTIIALLAIVVAHADESAQRRLQRFDGLWDGPDVVLFNLSPLGKSAEPESPLPPLKGEYLDRFQAGAARLTAISHGAVLLAADGAQGYAKTGGVGCAGKAPGTTMPGMMIGNMQAPVEFVVARGRLYIISSAGTVRRIFVDGRPHPSGDGLVPNCVGHSIGRWEADTLVVDTIGLLSGPIDMQTAHSDALHIVERFRVLTPTRIEDVITLEDANALASPWSSTRIYKRLPVSEVVQPDDQAAPTSDRHF